MLGTLSLASILVWTLFGFFVGVGWALGNWLVSKIVR